MENRCRMARILVLGPWLLALLLAFGCATGPVAVAPDDPLFGTWVNEQYDQAGTSYFAKRVYLPDGRELDYDYIAATEPSRECRNTIDKAWIDAEGNHWYRIHTIGWQYPNKELQVERFSLSRISARGTVLEQLSGHYDYPEELISTLPDYVLYHKRE